MKYFVQYLEQKLPVRLSVRLKLLFRTPLALNFPNLPLKGVLCSVKVLILGKQGNRGQLMTGILFLLTGRWAYYRGFRLGFYGNYFVVEKVTPMVTFNHNLFRRTSCSEQKISNMAESRQCTLGQYELCRFS